MCGVVKPLLSTTLASSDECRHCTGRNACYPNSVWEQNRGVVETKYLGVVSEVVLHRNFVCTLSRGGARGDIANDKRVASRVGGENYLCDEGLCLRNVALGAISA